MGKDSIRVLAVASGGGHWEQLMLLRPTLAQYDVRFATTEPAVAVQHGVSGAESLPDCNQNKPFASALCALVALWVMIKHRPQVILSTGAAPGFFCILAGRLTGARTLWIAAAAVERGDGAAALAEARRLVERRPIPAEHLTLLAIAQNKAGQPERAGLTIQMAAKRGWREPVAQEAVLRLALAAGDKPEAARRYAALFLRAATPNPLLVELGPAVLDETGGPGQTTLVDIISGTYRWHDAFLRRGVQVMPPAAFTEITLASMARGARFDCGVLRQSLKGLGQKDAAAAARLVAGSGSQCPDLQG